ncbi:DUF262 domain-containing protein [Chitinophaga filiformis]|uniref:DUF262 domain-containing protein n=1 Tax=Chitinophaga filiformis TaxID=104663 RepID=UPI001F1BE175|nr:DUF262 domain-containing protein [Chitinophaga filiformis]MCF6404602.1 DUF262 domain-containing protein [Chitinophaga filiformis]
MSSIANNIQADKRKLTELLHGKKYTVDYFQREYKWGKKHIEQLLVDLEAAFMADYTQDDTLDKVVRYNCYYLGPIVICETGKARSIVDGQQRLTSIMLLLIYLNNRQVNFAEKEDIEPLIFSRKGGRSSYNIDVPSRNSILDALFKNQEFDIETSTDFSVRNMYDRYLDIATLFPPSLTESNLPLFIEWLKENVVFVEILAYSSENAYTIFETMNDRGLNLTPTEMLKGYLLSNVNDADRIEEINELWKDKISIFHSYSPQEDQEFIKAWLRSHFAETIRSSAKSATNEDFEKIGTRFHTWVKDNPRKIGLSDPDSFFYFIKGGFDFYSTLYMRILDATDNLTTGLETLFIASYWTIADSLTFPLLLASINKLDDEETIVTKLNNTYKFIDTYTIIRTLNNKSITQTSVRYIIYSLAKEIRNKSLDTLMAILSGKLTSLSESLIAIFDFSSSHDNKKFVHYFLARITYYVEQKYSDNTLRFEDLVSSRKKNRFVLCPILNEHHYDRYRKDFPNENIFRATCRSLGNFLLLPNNCAMEFNAQTNYEKLQLLEGENLYALSCLKGAMLEENLILKPIRALNAEAILKRTESLYALARKIWNNELV